MTVHLIWCSNGYGNKAIVSVCKDVRKALEKCSELNKNQERYDNHYYYTTHEVEE